MKPVARVVLIGLVLSCGDSPAGPAGGGVRIDGPATLRFEQLGARATLRATTTDGSAVRWTSSLSTVAAVADGVVTATGDGSAHIIATAGRAADSVLVTVEQRAIGLSFLGPPEHAVRGEPFLAPVRLAAVDAGGSPVRSTTSPLSVSLLGGGGATLAGTTARVPTDGVATFDDLAVDVAAPGYRLAATGPGTLHVESTPFDVVAAPDRIVARNRGGATLGLLIDGAGAVGPFDDMGRVASDSAVAIIAAPGSSNEVIAFTRARPPVRVAAPWTAGTDTIAFTFPDALTIAVTVWIVKGPYETQRARAASAIATTSLIWDDERMGLDFSDVEFVDATADPDAPALYDLTLCNQQTQAINTIGKRPGRINIYYVGTVDGGTDRGRACGGGDFTMMAERSGHELLAHEIGHLFGLGHVDGDERFDRTNVMHSASNTRRYLTEAQVFRSHYNAFSSLRAVYGLRTDPARTCPDYETSPSCPSLARRLFADGGFPADLPGSRAEEWLLTSCFTGVARSEARGQTADELLRAFETGPPPGYVRALRAAEIERASALRARSARGDTFGLDGETLAALLAGLADAPGIRVAEFADAWRDTAARGLARVRP